MSVMSRRQDQKQALVKVDFRETLADGKRKAASEARAVIAAGVLAQERRECDEVSAMCCPEAYKRRHGLAW